MFQSWRRRGTVAVGSPEAATNPLLSLLSSFYTFVLFIFTCCLTPSIILLYFGVKICRSAWLRWLESRYPGLEFVTETTPRTAVDTRRNQGIITLLIGSDSPTDIQLLNNALKTELVRRRRLKQVLTSRWGRYAWVPRSEAAFRLENHVSITPATFKGRPLNDSNLQEYVSDTVSKLLPPDIPPWQVILINTQTGDSYLLIRIHHLYISMEKVSLGDLLMRARSPEPGGEQPQEESLLKTLFEPPVVIPQVYEQLCEVASNWANEAVSMWDPIENPSVWKGPPSLGLVARLGVVTLIAWARGGRGGLREGARLRGLTPRLITASALATLSSPFALVRSAASLAASTALTLATVPFMLVRDAPVYLYWLYLAHYVAREIISIVSLLYTAPRILLEELVIPEHPRNVHRLQTLSLCGRKAVCWSDPVDLASLEPLRRASSASTSEILIAATAASLNDYFKESGGGAPESLMTSCRVVEGGEGGGGVVVVPLPMGGEDGVRGGGGGWLAAVRGSLSSSAPRQPALYLASSLDLLTALLPALLARAALYLLSRRYTVGLTLITTDARPPKRRLLWGPTVKTLMVWRPPQANACLSLTLMSYGGEVRLGVMSDAQLSPHQATITQRFPEHLRAIAASASALVPSRIG